MTLPEALHGLLHDGAYPHPVGQIEVSETHISWVLLTGRFAYKLKKPVCFSFLDFSTLELREHYCREELRCNRLFAPELYLDVVPVRQTAAGSIHLGGRPQEDDTIIEWAVQMQQFDPAAQLDQLLKQNALGPEMLADFGRELARLHAALPRLIVSPAEITERVLKPVHDNFNEIAATGLQRKYATLLKRAQLASIELEHHLSDLFAARLADGYFRECHGDLHLSNLVLIKHTVTAFDCLEFNPGLRWIDTMSDVAFLFMDCHERERGDLAYTFLNSYLDSSGDYRGAKLLSYYAAYRSMVRAKVAALRWEQENKTEHTLAAETEERFHKHVAWATTCLERPAGTLVLMCGLSGAGKSFAAARLAPLLPAIRLRSDIARKTMAGLETLANTNSPVGGGLYNPARSDKVFAELAEIASALLQAGEHVIIDATFIEQQRRRAFLATADQVGARARIVYCDAPVDVLRERIETRATSGQDPSEATLAVLDAQLQKFEPPGPDEPVTRLATDQPLHDTELVILRDALLA